MPGPCYIPLGNFPTQAPRPSSAPAWSLPTLSGSLKPILILSRSSNLNTSSLGLRPPIPTACLTLESLLLSGPPVRDRVLPLGAGPVSGFPTTWRSALQPAASLCRASCWPPPCGTPPHHLAVGSSFFPGRSCPPPGEFPQGLLTCHPWNRPQPPAASFSASAFSSRWKPPPSTTAPFLPPRLVFPPHHWPAPFPQRPFPQLTGPRRSASVATELLFGLPRVRPAQQPITASRGSRRAAAQTAGKCCPRVAAAQARLRSKNYRVSQRPRGSCDVIRPREARGIRVPQPSASRTASGVGNCKSQIAPRGSGPGFPGFTPPLEKSLMWRYRVRGAEPLAQAARPATTLPGVHQAGKGRDNGQTRGRRWRKK